MKKIKMTFYNKVDEKLKPYIRHYFVTYGDLDENEKMQLLPMDHYDIIVPVEGKLSYVLHGHKMPLDSALVHGLRHKNITLEQSGFVRAWGISFTPWGFYAFYGAHMSKLTDKILKLSDCIPELNTVIDNVNGFEMNQVIDALEDYLTENIPEKFDYNLIEAFIDGDLNVGDFCIKHGIQRRSFERRFLKIIGVSPKDFKGIRQFEIASRALLYDEQRLSEIALYSDYYDQAHFTKNFKKYASYTPKAFVKEKPALKSKIDFD
ncbi:helix-turn-helix transcriptional regulator [Acidaminobacter sp. JC074]|uniref:helix-turn-helix domain-containing protein n=1 Tax=Acidaminobacter sp. JC074 TaxID=2530199 RepID=UPI001F0D6181|nr:AraC family transcriptional regulator [Acidaminobacter sp. JC074]MCH4886623.1 helix-turn-helix transcriptional regulator [Acidaminobacter sp. JC074]